MERFYNNEDDDTENESFFGSEENYDEDDDHDDMGDEMIGFIGHQQSMIDVMQMDLAQTELNQHLLSKAIDIAKSNWLWIFKDTNTRLDDIEKIYQRLIKLTDDDNINNLKESEGTK